MIINWLLQRKTKVIMIELPTALYHALETETYMQNNARAEDDQIRIDDIVTLSLAEHLQKNLWTNVIEDFDVVARAHVREASFEEKPKDNVRSINISAQRRKQN